MPKIGTLDMISSYEGGGMSEAIYQPKVKGATVNAEQQRRLYAHSIKEPDRFWLEQAKRLDWSKPPTRAGEYSFKRGEVGIKWFADGTLNVSANCLDRHLKKRGDKIAILWQGDDPAEQQRITYRQLHERVARFAAGLKGIGVRKGDRVTIYMPMVPEAAIAMLATVRIGAVHSVVFGGFSPQSLGGRIQDCDSQWVITADEGRRGGKTIPLKANVEKALADCPGVKKVVVFRRTDNDVPSSPKDIEWEAVEASTELAAAEEMAAEDPLFILYTSGSTGKPKGVLHTGGGYLVYASLTHEHVFDCREDDIYWCTADVGWVTGHSYIIYGPLANGATTFMFEGIPTWPDAGRFWAEIDRHKVSIFYTAPTAIRALMREGDHWVKKYSRTSLRVLGSVGEPINPEAWQWYYKVVGGERCSVVDTWWQTETGGILITPLPGAIAMKPGSATLPFFGIKPIIIDPNSKKPLTGTGSGHLCIAEAWPGIMRTVYKDHRRFEQTYFSTYDGLYFTGDGCRRDEDGYYWITGRVDDVINVSGHRIGTAEVESALVEHQKVAEAAVVGVPHDIKGQAIYAYVTPMKGIDGDSDLAKEMIKWVGDKIGRIAVPEAIHWAPSLPKTRSGKIMRRILRRLAEGRVDELGDTSTLADPTVVEQLVASRPS